MSLLVKWHVTTGYREYMRTEPVQTIIRGAAERVLEAVGGEEAGYAMDFEAESGRRKVPRSSVRTATFEAMEDEARNRTLTKNLDAARG